MSDQVTGGRAPRFKTPTLSRAWAVLLASAVFEAVWAIALYESQGLTKFLPAVIFVVATVLSMIGLAYGMLVIPVSVAYAVWTGVGAALTVIASFAMGTEPVNLLKVLFLIGIIGSVIGLRFAPESGRGEQPSR